MKEKIRFLSSKVNFSFEHNSPKDFVTSQWQLKEQSVIYLFYRWIVAGFYVFSVLYSIYIAICRGAFKVHFLYLTNLNLLATAVSTVLGAVLVTNYHRTKYCEHDGMTPAFKVFWCLSMCSTMYAILISFIYWAVLFHLEENVVDLNNIIVHVTNSCVLIIDIFVVKYHSRFSQFVWPALSGIIYLLIFTWLYPFFGGVNK